MCLRTYLIVKFVLLEVLNIEIRRKIFLKKAAKLYKGVLNIFLI